jgi:hypothetical protein
MCQQVTLVINARKSKFMIITNIFMSIWEDQTLCIQLSLYIIYRCFPLSCLEGEIRVKTDVDVVWLAQYGIPIKVCPERIDLFKIVQNRPIFKPFFKLHIM